ncbi:hypothetical protein [Actinoplanes couchii]|uniref:Uncharacterized protein n=1 Tax=Actinoplanes couchii TaxID=403638 RepID=A0ABQ3XCW9_9ACTN|nr:hypothetical protein [Actinoplanes couchii]MDR6321220.1 hypothetical protein [Actinoplanes couchii]GID56329.1 hypothetical protein Aco03nite_047330 [Actinoplanes couchii]
MARFWNWIKDNRTQATIGFACTVLALFVAVLALVRDAIDWTVLPERTTAPVTPAPPPPTGTDVTVAGRTIDVSSPKFFDFDAPGWPQTDTNNGAAADFVFQSVSTMRYAMVQAAFRVAAAGSGSGLLRWDERVLDFDGISEADCRSRKSAFGDYGTEDGFIPDGDSIYCVGTPEGRIGKVLVRAGRKPRILVITVTMWPAA